jgi:hypothetical protein
MTKEKKADLLRNWLKAKIAEDKAKAKRIKLDEEIESIYGTDFEGISKTFKEDELGFSVNLKKNIKYDLDQEAWKSIRSDIPAELRPEKVKFEIDVKGFEYLRDNPDVMESPDSPNSLPYKEYYKMVSDCVTIKNNKTTIKVEKI